MSTYKETPNMSKVESGFIVLALVAAFIADGAITSYKNFQGGAENIHREEQDAVTRFKEGSEYRARFEQLQDNIANLNKSTETKQARNKIAMEIKGAPKVELYSGQIREDITASSVLRAEFDQWVERELLPIRRQFQEKRLRASEKSLVGFVSGVSFSWFIVLLSIALSYLSTRQARGWRWVMFSLSFVPQVVSAQMAYDGALLKYGQQTLAATIGILFFVCMPPLYHFGIIALRSKRSVCVEEEATADEFEAEPANDNHGRFTHTKTETVEFDLTEEGYAKAIRHVADEMNAGNGHGLFTQVLQRFEPIGANKASLSRAIKNARIGKEVKVRLKNRLGTT